MLFHHSALLLVAAATINSVLGQGTDHHDSIDNTDYRHGYNARFTTHIVREGPAATPAAISQDEADLLANPAFRNPTIGVNYPATNDALHIRTTPKNGKGGNKKDKKTCKANALKKFQQI
ncbi:uncharacterized protein K452DRAFT_293562 [Aplosporella prunicola CBS 121167]|uniref:Uncharacterized protein n=1 Tax=Aplosporella prunicola CBS 121167 TaxID=1176127 RepID=A0A6A6BWJ0_9PEZI|nr:uncharacterized protein K452DRAFT_293562 [Aplosporella prunicola CBS 121167]KAF2147081.1 hypothetical protein K452DRAFT_293562 [Aplosporella prunicola CBS 121167]